jgi:hypothetical protein
MECVERARRRFHMPFCPKCRTEYTEEVQRCSDCGSELVASLSAEASGESKDADFQLVELSSFATVSEAEMVQELLESNGIRTVLRGEADPIGVTSRADPTTLLVGENDFARARELFEAFFAGAGDVTEEDD